jgi:PleD family two-component response regulator
VVYLARAQNCYRLAELGEGAGHRLNFCATECADCAFYRYQRGMAASVLIVTRDEALARRIVKRSDSSKISVRFAKSGYECATVIGTLRPALIVMDSDLPEVREGSLPESIMGDDRVPGVAVFVACREGDEAAIDQIDVPSIGAPFTAKQIEQLAERVANSARRVPRDVA